jgi:hypothetical protein
MGTIFGGLITGTCAGVWAWVKWSDRVIMIGSTSMLMGMVLVSSNLLKSLNTFELTVSLIESHHDFCKNYTLELQRNQCHGDFVKFSVISNMH